MDTTSSSILTRMKALETALVTSIKKDIDSILNEAKLIENYLLHGTTTPATPTVTPPTTPTA